MKTTIRSIAFLVMAFVLVQAASAQNISSAGTGNWSSTATWQGGVVPTATHNVTINETDTVTIDIPTAVCNNVNINGSLFFINTGVESGITVNGNISIGAAGAFKVRTLSPASATFKTHLLTLYGNLTNTGSGVLDFRAGSNGSTANGTNMTILGSSNTTISLTQTTYINSIEEFNGITVNKSGGAKVILANGNLFTSNNTSVGPAVLTLTNGIIETGSNVFAILATSNTAVVGASQASYVNGNLGRGMSNSAGATRDFAIGDDLQYRPFTLRSTTTGASTGHHVVGRVVRQNANTGSSVLAGGIDRVSAVRYFRFAYIQGPGSATMNFDRFYPSYGLDDGVSAGNTDLRAAYSVNERATWTGFGQTTNTDPTDLTNPPTVFRPDSLNPAITLAGGTGVVYVALARLTGTTTNDLGVGVYVVEEAGIPQNFYVGQNYPNPFNPSTTIEYGLPNEGHVTVKVFNLIGEEVTTLVNGQQVAGVHRLQFNANGLPSGTYFYRVDAGGVTKTNRMLLIK